MPDLERTPIVVTTTSDDKATLQRIAGSLLENKLAACVQISGPIESSYWWRGKIEQSQEWVCTIKTFKECCADLERAIQHLHNYDQPQLIGYTLEYAASEYVKWMKETIHPLPPNELR